MDIQHFYREGAAQGANPLALIARLYEQVIDDLRRAIGALAVSDIELRTSKINHAILVIGHLESHLDYQAGGKVAEVLRDFYDGLRHNLIVAQAQQSQDLLAQQITDLLAVREAWIEVDRTASSQIVTPASGNRGKTTSDRDADRSELLMTRIQPGGWEG